MFRNHWSEMRRDKASRLRTVKRLVSAFCGLCAACQGLSNGCSYINTVGAVSARVWIRWRPMRADLNPYQPLANHDSYCVKHWSKSVFVPNKGIYRPLIPPRGVNGPGHSVKRCSKIRSKTLLGQIKKNTALFFRAVRRFWLDWQVTKPVISWITVFMIYILTSNSITSLCSFTPGFVSTASISPLFWFGVVVIVFFTVITSH